MKHLLLISLILTGSISAHATSTALNQLTNCLILGRAYYQDGSNYTHLCSQDLKVNSSTIAELLLSGEITADQAAEALKKAVELDQNKSTQEQ